MPARNCTVGSTNMASNTELVRSYSTNHGWITQASDRARRRRAQCHREHLLRFHDLGDGVGCIEFHSKMNAIGADYLAMSEYDSYKSWLGNEMEPGPADMALPITLPISLIACAAATKKTRQSKKAIFLAH